MVVIAILSVLFVAITDYFNQNMDNSISVSKSVDTLNRMDLLKYKWRNFAHSSSPESVEISNDAKTVSSATGKVCVDDNSITFIKNNKKNKIFIPKNRMKLSFSIFNDNKKCIFGVLHCQEYKGKNLRTKNFRIVAHFGGGNEK
jgi:hypothetical protein